jgi:hypothetical protein
VPSYFFLVIYENNATSSSLKLAVTVIVIVDAEPVAVAVAPTKLILVIPVPTDDPALLISTPLITPVRFAPLPTKDVAVTTPDALRLVAAIVPTVILGVPDKPVAVPVTLPLKDVAVTIPAKLAPVLTFPTSCTLVTDILFLFSYLYIILV